MEAGQSGGSEELRQYGGHWGALGDTMVGFLGHRATEAIKGDGY